MGMERIGARCGIVGRLCQYLWRERLWWMIPMIVLLMVFAGLIMFSQSSAVAPFIYTLF